MSKELPIRSILFNYHAELPTEHKQNGWLHYYTQDPAIQLRVFDENAASLKRSARQQAQLHRLSAPALADSIFGSDLTIGAFKCTIAPLNGIARDSDFVHDRPQRAVARRDKSEQIRHEKTAFDQHLDQALALGAGVASADGTAANELPIYLFSVLLAIEWNPSAAERRNIEWAFRQASDFLWDVTNGCMAFGRVIVGGKSLMPAADIQLMASNRLLPRSWVAGLHEKNHRDRLAKYQPIRLGRGFWDNRRELVFPWEEPEGFRILVHEWAHYALGLADAYLHNANGAIIPAFEPANLSIMAHVQGNSELMIKVPQDYATPESEWGRIQKLFPDLAGDPRAATAIAGPTRLPLPLPLFHYVFDGYATPPTSAPLTLSLGSDPLASWYYSLHSEESDLLLSAYGAPLERRPRLMSGRGGAAFALPGATEDDIILRAPSNEGSAAAEFQQASVTDGAVSAFQSAALPGEPLIAVVPSAFDAKDPYRVSVQIVGLNNAAMDGVEVWICELGSDAAVACPQHNHDGVNWRSKEVSLQSLDGHVVLRFPNKGTPIYRVANFSQGGGPASHTGGPPPASASARSGEQVFSPIAAGSSDGNVMLFFDGREGIGSEEATQGYYDQLRIVTTRNHAPLAGQYGPIYAVAANDELRAEVKSTLVFHLSQARPAQTTLVRRTATTDWQPVAAANAQATEFLTSLLLADDSDSTLTGSHALRLDFFCLKKDTR